MDNTRKRNLVILIILLVITFGGIIAVMYINLGNAGEGIFDDSSSTATLEINSQILKLEVADEPHEHQIGLMNRTKLEESDGMIFIFEDESTRTFWMKNTFISLDIIFIDSNWKVLNIEKNTKTNQIEEVYSSNGNAMYVIELEAGKSDELGINNGDIIDFAITELKYEKVDTDV